MDTANIMIGIASAVFVVIIGAYVKVLSSRMFKSFDEKIKNVEDDLESIQVRFDNKVSQSEFDRVATQCVSMDGRLRTQENEIVALNSIKPSLDELKQKVSTLELIKQELLDKFTRRGDFTRDFQVLTSQLEKIHTKIGRLDERIDSIVNRTVM